MFPVIVYTHHNLLVFLSKMYNHNQCLMRWALLVQPYNIEICHKRRSENVVADALSWGLHSLFRVVFRSSFRNSFCFKGGKCYVLSLVGSVFIVCFSFSCCTDLVCSVLELELRPYCGLFRRDALGCIYGGNCGGFVGSPCSSVCPPQSLLRSLSMTRTC